MSAASASSADYLSTLSAGRDSNRPSSDAVKVGRRAIQWGKDLRQDIAKRLPIYMDDWKDGLNVKSISAIMFLYFACLLPAVAFGGIASQVTGGALGVVEYMVACGVGGSAYAIFSGQPMTLIGPTGLTLAFITALHGYTTVYNLPFLPIYSWVGLWTSGMMLTLAMGGASNLIKYATQFTDDVFNALLALNFLFEASRSLLKNFTTSGYNKSEAFLALNIAVMTYVTTRQATAARNSRYFTRFMREMISDFGPVLVIVLMSMITKLPALDALGVDFLEVPDGFMLAGGRRWLVPLFSVAPKMRLLAAVPAMLLTSLFFLDQNISSRVVNSPRHEMKKPDAYHLDILVLAVITGVLSIFGLPWQCAATVQSLNHVRAMTTTERIEDPDGSSKDRIIDVCETRVTGLTIHALILASIFSLPLLRLIPMPVVSGIFLYLGRKVMSGNGFLCRIKDLLSDQGMIKDKSVIGTVGFVPALRYTLIQVAMLSLLWGLKSVKSTSLFFPSVIGLLIVVRRYALPRIFTQEQLDSIDSSVG